MDTAPYQDDEYVRLAETIRDSASGAHGSMIVDFLPICKPFVQTVISFSPQTSLFFTVKYVPVWFPDAKFKQYAVYARGLSH